MKLSLKNWQTIVSAIALAAATANATDRVWIGNTGDWNVAGNWNPSGVPGAADNLFITNSGTYTATLSAASTVGSVTIGGASGTQTVDLNRFVLTLNSPSVINANGHIDMPNNCGIAGAGTLTVNGTLNFANGALNGTSAVTVGTGGVLLIGPNNVSLGRTVTNSGTATWSGNGLTMSSGIAFNNLAGATFDITGDGRLNNTTATINNSGLFRQTAGTTGTTIGAPFNNNGTVQVQTLPLSLQNGGTHTGTFNVAGGATLNLAGGTHTLSAATGVSGTGTLGVTGGSTVTANGTFNAGSTLSLTAGTVALAASCNVTAATVTINGGTLNYNSSGTVNALTLNAGTLGGTGPVTVTGLLTLGNGTVTTPLVTANGGININGGVSLNGAKLVNAGIATWSVGNITGNNGAAITNLPSGTFNSIFDGAFQTGAGTTPVFVNQGLFQKTGGTAALGATSIDFTFINTGTVEVRTNTLRYAVNQQTAGLTLLDGGNLSAQAQPIQLLGGSLVGTGLVTVANVQDVVNSAAISPGFSPGELDIVGNYQQTASGLLNIELGGLVPGTGFDLITVTAGGAGGVATLGGTLKVSLINGFSPAKGATFTFLTAASRVGAFATFNYPSNDIGMQLSTDATSAKVTVSNLKPVVANPIGNPAPGTNGAAFNFQFPANTFSDPDGDTLTYSALGMPAGITFTGATRTFSGTPTQAGVFPVAVAATDNGTPSLSVTNTFTMTVNKATPTATLAVNNSPVTYDGTGKAATVVISASSVPGAVANLLTGGTATKTAAGTYAVTADFVPTDTANYNSLIGRAHV